MMKSDETVTPGRDDRRMLDDHDRARLRIESLRWRDHGTKEAAVRDELDETMTTYYQRLNRLIEEPDALAAEPMIVRRLRRLRKARWEARSGCVHGTHT